MSMGRCQYVICSSWLGSGFRATFRVGTQSRAEYRSLEVLLCSTHEKECRPIRDKMAGHLYVTPEGYVYSGFWMDSLGFLVR